MESICYLLRRSSRAGSSGLMISLRASKRNSLPVVRKFDVFRQPRVGLFVFQRMRDVREVGPAGFDLFDHLERLTHAEMRRVRLVAERVDHQRVEAREEWPALLGDGAHVGAVGHVVESESQDGELAVQQADRPDGLAQEFEWLGRDALKAQLGHREMMGVRIERLEGVAE